MRVRLFCEDLLPRLFLVSDFSDLQLQQWRQIKKTKQQQKNKNSQVIKLWVKEKLKCLMCVSEPDCNFIYRLRENIKNGFIALFNIWRSFTILMKQFLACFCFGSEINRNGAHCFSHHQPLFIIKQLCWKGERLLSSFLPAAQFISEAAETLWEPRWDLN